LLAESQVREKNAPRSVEECLEDKERLKYIRRTELDKVEPLVTPFAAFLNDIVIKSQAERWIFY
jgi:hypothetical protein